MDNKDKTYTPVRFSHLTSYSGVGGIVQSAEEVFMVMPDIREWHGETEIDAVKRVCCALGIPGKELRMPPIYNDKNKSTLLPGYLFPTYAVCNKCNMLHHNPWEKQDKSYSEKITCKGKKIIKDGDNNEIWKIEDKKKPCKGFLTQVTWCVASKVGYLADVSWHDLCHSHKTSANADQRNCRENFDKNYLFLRNGSIICSICEAEVKDFKDKRLSLMKRKQPWLLDAPEQALEDEEMGRLLEINDPNVHMHSHQDALVIPPESRLGKRLVVDRLYSNKKKLHDLKRRMPPLKKKGLIEQIAYDFHCKGSDIEDALEQINDGYPNFNEDFADSDLFYDEYKALLKVEEYDQDEDFVTVHKTDELKKLKEEYSSEKLRSILTMIETHVLVTRLREIRVFKGFHRISDKDKDEDSDSDNYLIPPDIVGESNWFPAIELFGEGVFFSFNEKLLGEWEKLPGVKKRTQQINKKYENSAVNVPYIEDLTPRFLLLHTIAHLIIRELEYSAGYSASSLMERIYCSSEQQMAGVLIYTAVADIVGSLGGIIESTEPKEFLRMLSSAFEHAEWCSLDPVCTEHEGQGLGRLNRAACHACALSPETSCKFKNVFLDRIFIRGSKKLNIPSFLDFVKDYGQ